MSSAFQINEDVFRLKEKYFADPAKHIVLPKGEILLQENTYNDKLYLILEGTLTGYLKDENNENFEVFRSIKNRFVGVYSFFSPHHLSYLTVIAKEDTHLAYIEQHQKEEAEEKIARDFLPVIVHEIFLRQLLAQRLTRQRQAAINKLAEKEKMATLGQLAAGLAHELNNAVGVLERNTFWITHSVQEKLINNKYYKIFMASLNEGQTASTSQLRKRRKWIEDQFNVPTKTAKQLSKINLAEADIENLLNGKTTDLETVNLITDLGIILHDMNIAAAHAAHVVQSVQELGSTHKGKEVTVSLFETINKALTLTRNLTKDVNVVIERKADVTIKAVTGDWVQVWVNLIKNACESMNTAQTPEAELKIKLVEQEAEYVITINDNGPGIRPDMLDKIFQPNFTTKVNGLSFGLGLGLSIVNRVVQHYKGSIRVTSKPGETTFTISLPKI